MTETIISTLGALIVGMAIFTGLIILVHFIAEVMVYILSDIIEWIKCLLRK